MKKVLFLIGSLAGGGAERVLVDLVNNLPPDRFEITLQTIFDHGVHKSKLKNHIKYKTIVSMKGRFLSRIKSYLTLYYIPSSWLYKKFVKDDYDYEIAFLEGLPTKILGHSKSNAVKYAWVHTDLENNFDSSVIFRSQQDYSKCYKNFDKVICVSDSAKNGFIHRFGNIFPLEVVYNLIDENYILKSALEPIEEHFSSDTINLLSIGRFVHQKGFDRLVMALASLKQEVKNFKLRIVGDGPERNAINKLIISLGLEDCVELMNFSDNPYPYIKRSDILVCSSREEGYSTVVTEALILGKPVVTTNCAGMKELIGDYECGIIVENSEVGIYKGLLNILKNPDLISYYTSQAEKRGEQFRIQERLAALLSLFDLQKTED